MSAVKIVLFWLQTSYCILLTATALYVTELNSNFFLFIQDRSSWGPPSVRLTNRHQESTSTRSIRTKSARGHHTTQSEKLSFRNIFIIYYNELQTFLYKIQKKISESWYQQEYDRRKVGSPGCSRLISFHLLENKLKGIITTSNVNTSGGWNPRFRIILVDIGPFRELCSIGQLLSYFHFSILTKKWIFKEKFQNIILCKYWRRRWWLRSMKLPTLLL